MRGRVALSDPKIAATIRENYVAAVGEHMQLTRGPLRDWWLPLVADVNPRGAGGSTQGYYVLRADGSGVAFDNYPPRLPTFLNSGLAQFRARAKRAAAISEEDLRQAAPAPVPEGASVVRLFTRTRDDGGEPLPGTLLGRDYLWILREEVEQMVAASPRNNAEFALPPTLVRRLVVFHMVDNTRGQVWPYRPADVRSAKFTAKAVGTSGQVRSFTFQGDFAKQDSHPPQWTDRGHQGQVEGEFDVNASTMQITRFRAYADCTAWSDATYDRNAPPPRGRYAVVCAIIEATDDLARQVTPEPAAARDYYLGP